MIIYLFENSSHIYYFNTINQNIISVTKYQKWNGNTIHIKNKKNNINQKFNTTDISKFRDIQYKSKYRHIQLIRGNDFKISVDNIMNSLIKEL